MRLASIAAATAILLAAAATHAQVTARVVPNRTSGVAPLSVFVSGSSSQASGTNAIHDLHYEWNFGDAGSGSWPHSGLSRNEATGPWSGHVYDQPGTYTVSLKVTAPNGTSQSVTTTINVTDPNSVYSGSNTICFSASGNFSGCPAGAQRTTTSNFSTALGAVAPNRRYLFRRGDTFTSATRADINVAGPGTVGAYGSGAAPRIDVTGGDQALRFSYKTPNANDWRIMDLDFRSVGTPGGIAGGNTTARNILFYRLNGSGFHGNIGFSPFGPRWYDDPLHEDLSVVECNFDDHKGGNGGNGLYLAANRLLVLGNSIQNSEQIEHITRFEYASNAVLSHNYLARPASSKHLIKMHAMKHDGSWDAFGDIDSHNILISNNVFQSGLDGWAVALGPQNHFSDERIRDAIVERNLFLAGSGSQTYLYLNGVNHTARNNIFHMNGGRYHTAISVRARGIEPPPRNVRIYNNTCHTTDSASAVYCLREGAESSGTTVANNLLYAPNAQYRDIRTEGGTNTTMLNNLVATSSPYATASPSSASQFRLNASTEANDAGANLGWAAGDFSGQLRPSTGTWDVGAYEAGGSSGGGGAAPPAAPVLLP